MANKIQFKRGLKANVPALSLGEPAFCIDTKELYVGGTSGNILVNSLILRGSNTFNSITGRTITHSLGSANYFVSITPTASPALTIGEIWCVKDINTITVYCSGTATVGFDYIIILGGGS